MLEKEVTWDFYEYMGFKIRHHSRLEWLCCNVAVLQRRLILVQNVLLSISTSSETCEGCLRKVDIRLPGKRNSNSRGARPVYSFR
jgi:hypothetical protein